MSVVLKLAFAGDHRRGLEAYAALSQPTAADDRWAGVCHLGLRDPFEAKRLLGRAVARGECAARIELAAVQRVEGDIGLARETLAGFDLERATLFDRVLALREAAGQAQFVGDVLTARALLERAWTDGQGVSAGETFLAPVAQALAGVLGSLGHDTRAAKLLAFAARHANPARRVYVHGALGLRLTFSGDLDGAQEALAAAWRDIDLVPAARAVLTYYKGLLARAHGKADEAERLLTDAAALARSTGESETEAYALLAHCAVDTARGRFDMARAHLARARVLAQGPLLDLLVRLRAAALIDTPAKDATAELEAVAERFAARFLVREQGWALLHAADAHLAHAREDAATLTLGRAVDSMQALGGTGGLVVELRGLPRVVEWLRARPTDAYERRLLNGLEGILPACNVRLETLGAARLLVDGRPARLDLARTVEVLAWFMDHPDARLADAQLALFPDVEHRRSKSYLHQAREEVERAAPGVRIPYDRVRRTYRVVTDGVQLTWDARELEQILNDIGDNDVTRVLDAYHGSLLPDADGVWVRSERETLKSLVLRVGLLTMNEWYTAGEFEKVLTLASRLVDVDPFDETVNEFLVRATLELQGELAARRAYRRVRDLFEDELGELPPNLLTLGGTLYRLN